MDKEFVIFIKGLGVKKYKAGDQEIEFFKQDAPSSPMALDPVSLAKTFEDQMPPDSAMLFAATEGIASDHEDNVAPEIPSM